MANAAHCHHTGDQIQDMFLKDRQITQQYFPTELDIPHECVLKVINTNFKMTKMSAHWVLKLLQRNKKQILLIVSSFFGMQ